MAQLGRRERIARGLCVVVGVYLLLGLAITQVSKRLLRHRVERLLADLAALREQPADWNRFVAFQTRWGKWGHYEGSCTPAQCDYTVHLTDSFRSLLEMPYTGTRFSPDNQQKIGRVLYLSILPDLMLWQERLPSASGEVLIADGKLRRQRLRIEVDVSKGEGPGDSDGGPAQQDEVPYSSGEYTLMARLEWLTSHLDREGYLPAVHWPEHDLHPESMITQPSGCMNCISATAVVTPYTAPEEAAELTRLNLNCLTRWKPCTYEGDILPGGFRRQEEDRRLRRAQNVRYAQCDYPRQQLYDLAENAALMTVTASAMPNGFLATTLRLVRQVKGPAVLDLEKDYRQYFTAYAEHDQQPLPVGAQVLVLYREVPRPEGTWASLGVYPCGILPAAELAKISVSRE